MARIQEFDFSVNLLQALLWQYNQATNLQGLLEQKQEWYDVNQRDFWEAWYRDVFDLRTANAFGLAVWAIILNARQFVYQPPNIERPIFGFGVPNTGFGDRFGSRFSAGTSLSFFKNFNNGNFGTSSGAGINGLDLEQSRILLRLRYFNLAMRPSVPQINAFVNEVFKDLGKVVVLDNYDMTCTYVFLFALPSSLIYVLNNFDVLPRPAGVALNITTVPRDKVFGFGDAYVNFNNGNFGV